MKKNSLMKPSYLLVGFSLALLLQSGSAQAAQVKSKIAAAAEKQAITAPIQQALDHISSEALRGHLSFIASDLLEGRNTPSRGLDLAAEYIAAQFRAAGLEAAGDDGYFQTADWTQIAPKPRRAANAVSGESTAKPSEAQAVQKVRNVIGILRGSDPILKDSYVLISAHYDHLGVHEGKIYTGANDDGSGTVSVIELARAFASMSVRPKRSLVFITFFGEEKGLVGSRYYGAHPVFPIAKTIAGINIEQVGRTDDSEGPQVASAGVTGFDFSEVGKILREAGLKTGIKVWKHPQNSDRFFGQSDNQALADQGIPAHTVSVAYLFPDYHSPNDTWDKIDYDNMAKVDRAIALAAWTIADSTSVPHWDANNPKAEKYLKAWDALQGKPKQ